MKITVIGTGYVGLVTGACLADAGHTVCCLDNDRTKIANLRKNKVPFYEPGLVNIIKKAVKKRSLTFTSSYKSALKESEVIFLCIGTPPNANGSPNLNYLKESLFAISLNIKANKDLVIFIKSTVPVGTNSKLRDYFFKISKNGSNAIFASNPEFLREGSAVFDFENPDRIIIGASNRYVREISNKIYNKVYKKRNLIQFTTIESAELIKYSSNAFLATKISFINEISRLCDATGANIKEIQKGMGTDPRIGKEFLNAGLGFGGSCFPKDLDGLLYNFHRYGLQSHIALAAKKTNSDQLDFFITKVKQNLDLKKSSLLVWGLSFKPDTDDIRESVSIKIIERLAKTTKKLFVFDPVANENAKSVLKTLKNVTFCKSQYQHIEKCDALILATEWKEFLKPDMKNLLKLKKKIVFDGRNAMPKQQLEKNGLSYFGIGQK